MARSSASLPRGRWWLRSLGLVLAGTLAISVAACGRNEPAPDPAAVAEAAENLKTAEAFLAETAKAEGVKATPSGLLYKITTKGPGTQPPPLPGDEVKVLYEGRFADGTVFDENFTSGDMLYFDVEPWDGSRETAMIRGFNEAVALLQPGDEGEFTLPPGLAYGEEGRGPIPPNTALVFRIRLVGALSRTEDRMG